MHISYFSKFQLTYKADSTQIGFLQLLSAQATQNITYHCKNSVAYFDATKHTFRKGLKLMSWGDIEITPKGNKLRYEVIKDGCRVGVNLGKSQSFDEILIYCFRYSTEKTPGLNHC